MDQTENAPQDDRSPKERKPKRQLRDKLRRAKGWVRSRWPWVLALVIFILMLTGILAWMAFPYLSGNEAFRRSRRALEGYAARVKAEGPTALQSPPSRLGYFAVHQAQPLPHGFLFASDYGNPFDWNGIAYSTEPLPPQVWDSQGELLQDFKHIDGNWYWVWRPDPDRFVNGVASTQPARPQR